MSGGYVAILEQPYKAFLGSQFERWHSYTEASILSRLERCAVEKVAKFLIVFYWIKVLAPVNDLISGSLDSRCSHFTDFNDLIIQAPTKNLAINKKLNHKLRR